MKVFKRPYRHYNLLMTICFWLSAFWLTWIVMGHLAPGSFDFVRPVRGPARIILNLNGLFAMFLVTARFMRDEYAEQIWQQTARLFVNFMILGPLTLLIVTLPFSKQVTEAIPAITHPRLKEILARPDEPSVVFFFGIMGTLLIAAQVVPQLFVVLYRWKLWRGSR